MQKKTQPTTWTMQWQSVLPIESITRSKVSNELICDLFICWNAELLKQLLLLLSFLYFLFLCRRRDFICRFFFLHGDSTCSKTPGGFQFWKKLTWINGMQNNTLSSVCEVGCTVRNYRAHTKSRKCVCKTAKFQNVFSVYNHHWVVVVLCFLRWCTSRCVCVCMCVAVCVQTARIQSSLWNGWCARSKSTLWWIFMN